MGDAKRCVGVVSALVEAGHDAKAVDPVAVGIVGCQRELVLLCAREYLEVKVGQQKGQGSGLAQCADLFAPANPLPYFYQALIQVEITAPDESSLVVRPGRDRVLPGCHAWARSGNR